MTEVSGQASRVDAPTRWEPASRVVLPAGPVRRRSGSRLDRVARRPSWLTRADLVALLVVVASVGPRIWTLAETWFWQDDFVNASSAVQQGLSADYLLQDYNGHLMPAKFLVVWAAATLAPGSWLLAAVVVTVLSTLAVAAWWWALRVVFGPRLVLVVPLAVIAFCPLLTVPVSWWASALEAFPVQIAMALAVVGHVRSVRDGRRWGAVLAVVALVGGLAWIEKTLLVLLVLGWVDLALLRRVPVAWRLAQRVKLWLAYAGVAVVYVLLYLSRIGSQADRTWDADAVGRFLYDSVLSTFPVGMVGGPWQTKLEASTLLPLVVQPWLMWVWAFALAVVVASFVRRGWAAFRGWSLLVGYLFVAVGLVATTRLDFLGPVIGRDPRYLADVVPVAALALAAAFLPAASRAVAPARPSRAAAPRLAPRPVLVVAVASLVVVYALSSWVTTYRVAEARGRTGAQEWVSAARASVADAPDAVLYDADVPDFVVAPFFDDYARQSRVLEAVGVTPRFDEPTVDLRILDGSGALVRAELIVSGSGRPGPSEECGWRVAGRPVSIPVPAVDSAEDWVVRVGYYAARPTEPRIDLGDSSWTVPLPAGLHELSLFPGDVQDIGRLRISGLAVGQQLCVTDVDVGRAWPAGQPLPPGGGG